MNYLIISQISHWIFSCSGSSPYIWRTCRSFSTTNEAKIGQLEIKYISIYNKLYEIIFYWHWIYKIKTLFFFIARGQRAPKRRTMKNSIAILVLTILITFVATQVRSDGSDHRYKEGDIVPLYANKVGPFHNPRYVIFSENHQIS